MVLILVLADTFYLSTWYLKYRLKLESVQPYDQHHNYGIGALIISCVSKIIFQVSVITEYLCTYVLTYIHTHMYTYISCTGLCTGHAEFASENYTYIYVLYEKFTCVHDYVR